MTRNIDDMVPRALRMKRARDLVGDLVADVIWLTDQVKAQDAMLIRAQAQTNRLCALLREHGIDPYELQDLS